MVRKINQKATCTAASEAAENAVLDEKSIFVDDENYRAFTKALERPAEIKPLLNRLMRSSAPWKE